MSNDEELLKLKLNRRKQMYLILSNIDRVFEALTNVYEKLGEKEKYKYINSISKLIEKGLKLLLFACTVTIIVICYYFYVYWTLLPRLEGTTSGFTLKFWKQKQWEDYEYRTTFTHLVLFHLFLFIGLICFFRTIFTNPGYMHEEYTEIYSIVNFLKIFFEYILNFRDKNYSLSLKRNNQSLFEDIQKILNSRKLIRRTISEYKESYLLNNLELNMKENDLSFDDNSVDYCEDSRIQARTSILDGFEKFENEYLQFIDKPENKLYAQFYNEIEFKEKNFNNKRFCSFCLLKKPDRTHHCRHCHQCVRRSDHHCHILSTCIGFSNYKFFFLTLLYFSLLLNYMFFTSFSLISFYICEYKDTIYSVFYLTYFIFIAILAGFMTFFTGYHIMLLVSNLTTIEYKEKIKGHETNNFFNLGLCFNLNEIFGPHCLFWLLPLSHLSETSGYSFKINEDIYEEIMRNRMTGQVRSISASTSEANLSPSPTPV